MGRKGAHFGWKGGLGRKAEGFGWKGEGFGAERRRVGTLTGGRVLSKAPMAILKPAPSASSTLSFGILTSSKAMPRVSEQRCPMFSSCLTGVGWGMSAPKPHPPTPKTPPQNPTEQ